MVVRGYEFYVQVARTISHSIAALTREILLLPQEHKIQIFELTCNMFFFHNYVDIQMGAFLAIFRGYFSYHFPKISEGSLYTTTSFVNTESAFRNT